MPSLSLLNTILLAGSLAHKASGLSYSVPSSPPSNSSPRLDSAPVGVSLEFFTFPDYVTTVPATHQCLQNLKDLTGVWPPVRIGGTTQDRATYDASSSNAVTYSVSDPADAPASLTFGPSFFDLADEYEGQVTIGLNRRLNNIDNTVAAAKGAHDVMGNLEAIELGNEPNFFTSSDPIAEGSWSAAKDRTTQVEWQKTVANAISTNNIISAGVFFDTETFSISSLAAQEGDSLSTVKEFCSHNYPQWSPNYDLAKLMNHAGIKSQIAPYQKEIDAAHAVGKDHVMGETNSATQGGGGISPTFGAGLWIVDYVLQSVTLGMKSLLFHQGTIGNCQYCWWGRYSMGAPYYGAYFVTMALANADYVAPLDDQTSNYAAYAVYKDNRPIRVILYNSDYYTSGTRGSQTYTLTGLSSSSVKAKRLTAPYATSRQDRGEVPSIAGQSFTDGTCVIKGSQNIETATVSGGSATFTVAASEALLIEL